MLSNGKNKKIVVVLLILVIALSGINFDFSLQGGAFIQFGEKVEAASPVIDSMWPEENRSFNEGYTIINPEITISNIAYQRVVCKYYLDSESVPRGMYYIESQSLYNTQKIVFSNSLPALDLSKLSEGMHKIIYEVYSYNDGSRKSHTVNFIVDRSGPTIGPVTWTSTNETITISASASDISGLATDISRTTLIPYRYTIGYSEVSEWTNITSYTSKSHFPPNCGVLVKFEAMDVHGHISNFSTYIHTKANIPSFTINNASSYTLDVTPKDGNNPGVYYMIKVNDNQYMTQEGTLTVSPVWIKFSESKRIITLKGLNPNTTYTFTAKARNSENEETVFGPSISATTLVAPPGSPANIIATATDKIITVAWEAVSGAIGYDIEADGTVINNGTATVYTHANLNPGVPHTYRVRARNAGGNGNWSAPISKSTLPSTPDIPQNLNAIPLSTSVTVTWNNIPGATGYDIEVDGILVNNGPNTNYIHNSLTPGTHHSYRVRSINPGGKSEWSEYINTTTQLGTVPVPVNITAATALDSVTLSWDTVSGASGYDIEVDGVTFDNGSKTMYTHGGLAPASQHIYRVRAKKGGVNSDWSAAVVASTRTNTFGIPDNFKANANNTSVILSWEQVPEADGYEMEIDGVVTDNGSEISCIHDGLVPNTSHTYRVRAQKGTEASEWTQPLTVMTFNLVTPQNVTATSDETAITVNWEPVDGAGSYDMEFDGSIMTGINALPATYTITGLTPNTQHRIRIRAVDANGASNWSLPLIQSTLFRQINVPNVSGLAKKTAITLMWNKIDGAAAYEVEADGIVTSNINGTTYKVTGLIPGTQHAYRVRALNSSGEGGWSNTFTIWTLPEGPAAPANITTSSNMTSILLTWSKVAEAEEYELEVDGTVVKNGTGTSYLHTGLLPETSHKYRVRAKNISGFSEWSAIITANTLSSVQEYEIESVKGEEFALVLSASNIQDIDKYTFTIQYNTEDFEIIDLCGLTAKVDSTEGDISGTDITVKQAEPGTIVFTKTGLVQSWQVWSGIVNSITFKAKKDGKAVITYTIQ